MQQRIARTLAVLLFITLLLWGVYGLLSYIGVPIHGAVLFSEAAKAKIGSICMESERLCRGWHGLFPTISFMLSRARPFLGYAVLSFLFAGVLLGVRVFKTGAWRIRFRLTPWKGVLIFLGSVWLLFTTLSFSSVDGIGSRRLFEPLPQVYVQAGPQALLALQENFDELREAGCLSYVGETNHGAGVYDLKVSCIQQSFITRVLTHFALILLLLFEFLVLGRAVIARIGLRPRHVVAEAVVSAAVGASTFIALLWLLALAGLYTQLAGWLLLLVVPGLCWRQSLHWLDCARSRGIDVDVSWHSVSLVLGWLLCTYLAFNFLTVVRPFPIGWDDLGRYLNQPRLLVSYGHFIPTLASFQWEYITSLGFLLFGFDSIFGATLAMLINWSAGLLAVASVYALGRIFLGPRGGILSALLYYTLPVVGHFSFADMKVDNAIFTMGAVSTLCVFLAVFPPAPESDGEEPEAHADWRWILLAGILGGVAFAMKPTAIMVVMTLGAIIFGAMTHGLAFAGSSLLVFAVYVFEGRLNISNLAARVAGDAGALSRPLVLGALVLLGLAGLAGGLWLRRDRARGALVMASVFIAGFLGAIAPWIAVNNYLYGNVVPGILFTAPNNLTPTFEISGGNPVDWGQPILSLPPELVVDTSNAACKATGMVEELDRYWGFRSGWGHYLLLPWRAVMNLDSVGYYVTMVPALLLFPLLLLLPAFWRRHGAWLRYMFWGTVLLIVQWAFLANGIPWYGIGMFLGLSICLEALVARSPDRWSKTLAGALIAFSLVIAFGMRLWQFEQQRNLLEFPMGKASAEAMRERTIPYYDDIRAVVMDRFENMPDRPYVYRVGTFIPYFIPKNLEVLPVADNQLDFFKCLYQEGDAALTLKRLQALGFNSVIFDTNTATIERDVNGTLHKKVQSFVDFLNTAPLGFRVLVNDHDAGVVFVLLP